MAVLDYRETKTYVVRVEEAVTQTLDDHIVMTQVCGGGGGGGRVGEGMGEEERACLGFKVLG